MRRQVFSGSACALPMLALIAIITVNGSPRTRIASSVELSAVRGAGSCIWNSTRFCPNGDGCSGEVCAYGVNPGNWLCPVGGQNLPDNPNLISYSICKNVNTGLTECGFTTQISCGFTDTCATGCTAGGPVGVQNPVPSVCLVGLFVFAYASSNQASGDYCFGS